MANESKPSRTQVGDLSVPQQEMTEEELQQVKGGVQNSGGGGDGKSGGTHKFEVLPYEIHTLKKDTATDTSVIVVKPK